MLRFYIYFTVLVLAVIVSLLNLNKIEKKDKAENIQQEKDIKKSQKYYDKKVKKWDKEEIEAKNIYEIYKSQIDWNLQIQLSWIAVMLACGIGLFELISPDTSFDPSYFQILVSIILILGIDTSFRHIIALMQKMLRNEMIINASFRFDGMDFTKKYGEWSLPQKYLLHIVDNKPTRNFRNITFIRILIWLGCIWFILERLGDLAFLY